MMIRMTFTWIVAIFLLTITTNYNGPLEASHRYIRDVAYDIRTNVEWWDPRCRACGHPKSGLSGQLWDCKGGASWLFFETKLCPPLSTNTILQVHMIRTVVLSLWRISNQASSGQLLGCSGVDMRMIPLRRRYVFPYYPYRLQWATSTFHLLHGRDYHTIYERQAWLCCLILDAVSLAKENKRARQKRWFKSPAIHFRFHRCTAYIAIAFPSKLLLSKRAAALWQENFILLRI